MFSFGLGDFVFAKELGVVGVVIALESVKTLDGKNELRYRVLLPDTPPLLLKESQLEISDIEERHEDYGYVDSFSVFEVDELMLSEETEGGLDTMSLYEAEDTEVVESMTKNEIELALLDLLIDGSLKRGNKEEFLEHTSKRKTLLKRMQQ